MLVIYKLKSRLQVVHLVNQLSDPPPKPGLYWPVEREILCHLDPSSLIIDFYCVYNCIPEALYVDVIDFEI